MNKLTFSLIFSITIASPLHAALIITDHAAEVEVMLAFESPTVPAPPPVYDDRVFVDTHEGGANFDVGLSESGTYNNFYYSGHAIARGAIGALSPSPYQPPAYDAVFTTFQLTDDEGFNDMHAYSSSLINASISFTITEADVSGYLMGIVEPGRGPGIEQSYILYDITDGTSVASPDTNLLFMEQYVTLLQGHDYVMAYRGFREMHDGPSEFGFYADTEVINSANVPTPSNALLFTSGLLGLMLTLIHTLKMSHEGWRRLRA
jgi:hypothetical protein